MATLSSLLRYALTWNLVDEPESQSPITAINSVVVGYEAYLTRGNCREEDLFRPQARGLGNVQIGCHGLENTSQKQSSSIEALAQLILPYRDPPYNPGDHFLAISVEELSDMNAWLQQVR